MSNEQLKLNGVRPPAQVRPLERSHRRRQDGVAYKLRVIEGSGGLLELVEEQPKSRSWFMEYARVMQLTGWTL